MRKRGTHQGIPSCSCDWTLMKLAKMPKLAELPTSMIKVQKLSCTAGQWYLVRTRTAISVMVETEETIFADQGR